MPSARRGQLGVHRHTPWVADIGHLHVDGVGQLAEDGVGGVHRRAVVRRALRHVGAVGKGHGTARLGGAARHDLRRRRPRERRHHQRKQRHRGGDAEANLKLPGECTHRSSGIRAGADLLGHGLSPFSATSPDPVAAEHDQSERHDAERDGVGEKLQYLAAVRDMQNRPTDDFIGGGVVRVDGLVVVALEGEARRVAGDDAVECDEVLSGHRIAGDLANLVRIGFRNDDQVSLVIYRIHANTRGYYPRNLSCRNSNRQEHRDRAHHKERQCLSGRTIRP